MLAIREFSTFFHGQSLLLLDVDLEHVFSRLVARRKWHEAWWKKNPLNWIKIHFWPDGLGFFFHHASCHLLWPAGLGFTCHKCTANNVKPSPSNKVQKPLRVDMERELVILANDHSACMLWPQCLHVATQCKHVATQFLFFISMHLHCASQNF